MFKKIDNWLMNLSANMLAWARQSSDVSYEEFKVIKQNHDDALAKRNEWLASRSKK